MATPWDVLGNPVGPEQTYNDTENNTFVGDWVRAINNDWDLINLSNESREIYDRLRHHKYETEEEADALEKRFADITEIEQQTIQNRDRQKQALFNRGTLGGLAARSTSLGGSLNAMKTQVGAQVAGLAADNALNALASSGANLGLTAAMAKAGWNSPGIMHGPLGAIKGALAAQLALQPTQMMNMMNYVGAAKAGIDESQLEGWEAFRRTLQEGGTIEQAEQAQKNVTMKNLPITGAGSLLWAYAGNRMLGGAKGLLGGTAARNLSRLEKLDPIEKLATYASKKTGSSAIGTGVGILGYETLNTGGENVQEITQNNIQDVEVNRALGKTGPESEYSVGGWLNALTSDEGVETLKETTGSTLLMSILGLPLSGRNMVKGGYGVQKANTFGQNAIKQLRANNIKPSDPTTFDQGHYNTIKQIVGEYQGLMADEIEKLDFQDVATGYSAFRAQEIMQNSPNIELKEAIEIANNEFVSGISKDKSHATGPRVLSDAYKKFAEQTNTKNNYNGILVDPVERQRQENTITTSQPTPSEKIEQKNAPLQGTFKEGNFDPLTKDQRKNEQTTGTEQPVANTGLEVANQVPSPSTKVGEIISGSNWEVTNDKVPTGIGDNYRYNTVEITDKETQNKYIVEQRDDNSFVVSNASGGIPTIVDEVGLRNLVSKNNTINMSNDERVAEQTKDYETKVAEEIYKGMENKENLVRNSGDFWKWAHTGDNIARSGLTQRDVHEIAIGLGRANLNDTEIYFNTNKPNELAGTWGVNIDKNKLDYSNNTTLRNIKDKMKTNSVIMLWNGADATTVLHELSHGGFRSLSKEQRDNYINLSYVTMRGFVTTMMGLPLDISDVELFKALQAIPPQLHTIINSGARVLHMQLALKLSGMTDNQIMRDLLESGEIVKMAEERYANEFTMWYFGGYLSNKKPQNFFQMIADGFCRMISDVLHACDYTANFLNSPDWKLLKQQAPKMLSQMTLYENQVLGQGVWQNTAQPVPEQTIVNKPQPVQPQPVVQQQLIVKEEPMTKPQEGPNITPNQPPVQDKPVKQQKKQIEKKQAVEKPIIKEEPSVVGITEETPVKEVETQPVQEEIKQEQPVVETTPEVKEVKEEPKQEQNETPSKEELEELLNKKLNDGLERDKHRTYLIGKSVYSVEYKEGEDGGLGEFVIYKHVNGVKKVVSPTSKEGIAITLKRWQEEADSEVGKQEMINRAQREKERAGRYLSDDGNDFSKRIRNNAEYNNKEQTLRRLKEEIKNTPESEKNTEDYKNKVAYVSYLQDELRRINSETMEQVKYDRDIYDNTDKAIESLKKIKVKYDNEVKNEKPQAVKEVKKETVIAKPAETANTKVATPPAKKTEATAKKKPEPTKEEKVKEAVNKLIGYKDNKVRRQQINNQKNGWLTDENKLEAIDNLMKSDPEKYASMLPNELLEKYKDIIKPETYNAIVNERKAKEDKSAAYRKNIILKNLMKQKYKEDKNNTWDRYNKDLEFKKQIDEEVDKIYNQPPKTKEEQIADRLKDEKFVKRVEQDVLKSLESPDLAAVKMCYDAELNPQKKANFLRSMAEEKIKAGYIPKVEKKAYDRNEIFGQVTDQKGNDDYSWVDNMMSEHAEPEMTQQDFDYLSNSSTINFSNAGDMKIISEQERKENEKRIWDMFEEALQKSNFIEFSPNIEAIFRNEANKEILEGNITNDQLDKLIERCKKWVEQNNKKNEKKDDKIKMPSEPKRTAAEINKDNESIYLNMFNLIKSDVYAFDRKLIVSKEAEEVFNILRKRTGNKDYVKLDDFRDATNHFDAYNICYQTVKLYSATPKDTKVVAGFPEVEEGVYKGKKGIKRIILHKDGLMGAIILNNGSIGSFFFTPKEKNGNINFEGLPKNSLESLLLLCISHGGVKTECTSKELCDLLQKYGFQYVCSGFNSNGGEVYQLIKQPGDVNDAVERVIKKTVTPIQFFDINGNLIPKIEIKKVTKEEGKKEKYISTIDEARLFRDCYMIDETFNKYSYIRAQKRYIEEVKALNAEYKKLKDPKEILKLFQEKVEIYRRNALKYGRKLNYAIYRTLERNEGKVYGDAHPGEMNRDQRQRIWDVWAKEYGFASGIKFQQAYNDRLNAIEDIKEKIKTWKENGLTQQEKKDLELLLRARTYYWNYEEAYNLMKGRTSAGFKKLNDWMKNWKQDKSKYININSLNYLQKQLGENTIQSTSGEKFYYYAKMELYLRPPIFGLKKKFKMEDRSDIGTSYNTIWYSNIGTMNSDFEVVKQILKKNGFNVDKFNNHILLENAVKKDFMKILNSKDIVNRFGQYTKDEVRDYFDQTKLHVRFNLLDSTKMGLFPSVVDAVNDQLRKKYGGIFVGIDGKIRLFASDKNSKVKSEFLCSGRFFKTDEEAEKAFEKLLKKLDKKNGGMLYLRDILDHSELYEIYPGLEDTPVLMMDKESGALGRAHTTLPWKGERPNNDGTDNMYGSIEINFRKINEQIRTSDEYKGLNYNELLRGVLIHEIQHIIQGKEYFAEGNNTVLSDYEWNELINERYKDYLGNRGLVKFGQDFFGYKVGDIDLLKQEKRNEIRRKSSLTAKILNEMFRSYEFDMSQQYSLDEFEKNYGVSFDKAFKEIEEMDINVRPENRIKFFQDLMRYRSNNNYRRYKTDIAKLIFNCEQYFGVEGQDRIDGFIKSFFEQAYEGKEEFNKEFNANEGRRNYEETVGEQESKTQERKLYGIEPEDAPQKYGDFKYITHPFDEDKKTVKNVDGLVVNRPVHGLDKIQSELEYVMNPNIWYSNNNYINENKYNSMVIKDKRKLMSDWPEKYKNEFNKFFDKNKEEESVSRPTIKIIDDIINYFNENMPDNDKNELFNKIEQLYNIKHINNSDFFNSDIYYQINKESQKLINSVGISSAKETLAEKYGIAVDNSGNIWSGVYSYNNSTNKDNVKTTSNFDTYDLSQSHILFSNSGNQNFHGLNYNDYHNYADKYKDVYRVTFTKSSRSFEKRKKEMKYLEERFKEWKQEDDKNGNVIFTRIVPYPEYKKEITYNGINDSDTKEYLVTPKERTKSQQIIDEIKEHYENFVTNVFNDYNPVYRLCKNVGAEHAYEKMVVFRNQGNLAYDAISNGFKYYDSSKGIIERSASLESIVATIGTEEVPEIGADGKETGKTMNQQWRFIMYGYAKRAIELDKRNIKQPISRQEAEAIVNTIENSQEEMIDRRGNKSTVAAVYQEELKKFIEYNNRLLHVLVEGGLHSEEEYMRMLNANQWYIPLEKDFSEEDGDITPIEAYIKHSASYVNLKSPLKLIKGSEYKKIKNPLEVARERTIHFFSLKAKNEVALTLIDEVLGKVTYTANDKAVLVNGNVIHKIAPYKFTKTGKPLYNVSDKDYTFYVMRNGQKEVYQCADKQLFLTLRNLDQEQLKFLNNKFIKPLTMPAKMVRTFATSTPDFGIGNVIRDTMTAWATSENGFMPFYDSAWGMYQYLYDTQWAREYLMNNGEFTTMLAEEDINNVLTVKEKQKLGKILNRIVHPRSKFDCMSAIWTLFTDKGVMALLNKIQGFNTMLELGTRIAEYKNARMGYEQDFIGEKRFFKGGLLNPDIKQAVGDIIHASKVAKDITINFGQHGRHWTVRAINRFIPFFNALLQGIYKQLNTMGYATQYLVGQLPLLNTNKLTQAEKTRGKYALLKLGMLAVAGILKAYEGAGDDDYDDAQDWEKEANWVFSSGFKFPKDQEFGRLIGGTFEKAAYRYIKTGEIGASDIFLDALSCFSPDSFIPSIASLMLIMTGPGYNTFTKQTIIPEWMARKNEVGYKQVDMYTSNMAADLSYFLYKILHVDVSAKKLDAALQSQLSNTNKYIKGFYDVARELATGQPNPPAIPRGAQPGDFNWSDDLRHSAPKVVNAALQPLVNRFNTRRNTPQQVIDFQEVYKKWSKFASTGNMTKEQERAWGIVQKANAKDANERKKKKKLREQFLAGKISEPTFLQQNEKIDKERKTIAEHVKKKTSKIELPFVIDF